ncbi:hypothetical protein LTR64_005647 [Lithohypha guttulata]|uniref:uncharacterized protein n=1 Tax=Lithohypha guttulata TaxID=1690604 RepID=UPI002DE0C0B0|nr:hypothetical protein LTR51_002559 [Lithohypha guttulata]
MSDSGRIGQVLALDGPLLDQLREAKAFKTTQNWNLFRTPSTLFRQETAELGCDIEDVNEQKTTLKRLIVGEKMSGKSVHLLQAMSMAYLNKWMVINVPDCQEYVLNQSAYAPLRKKNEADEQVYVQPQLTSDLLTRFAYSNSNLLSKLTPIHNHSDLPKGRNVKTLHDLAMIGAQESSMATRIWDAVWKELTTKSQDGKTARPPILIAIDGINFWMGMTKYHSADYKPIHAHQFKLIKQLLTQVFNTTPNSLPNGGIVLACTTKSNHPSYPSFDLLVNQIRALNQGTQRQDPGFPLWDPYLKEADQRVYDLLNTARNTQLVELKGLSKPESKGLLEYFALSGMLREAVTDNTVAEKWTLSGGGVVGEMCKLGARARTSMFATGPREGVRMRA